MSAFSSPIKSDNSNQPHSYPYNKCYVCGTVVRGWQPSARDQQGLRHTDCVKPQPSTDDGKPRCNPDS
jgi:hypothetical protein